MSAQASTISRWPIRRIMPGFGSLDTSLRLVESALRPGGTMLIVTKRPEWYEQNMPEWYDDVSVVERKGYFVFQGVRGA